MTALTLKRRMLLITFSLYAAVAGCSSTDPDGGNAAPLITISSPTASLSVPESTEVLFAGTAVDPEEGQLPDSVLRWSSTIDGPLGSGDSLRLTTLAPGQHRITLQADDSTGKTGRATVDITVVGSAPVLGLDTIASGFDNPVFLTSPPNDSSRLFVVEQSGAIRIIKNGVTLATPFLDLSDSVSTGNEQGLLGLAFDPNYATTRRFYVSYTRLNGNSVLARYLAPSATADVATPASGVTILGVAQPYSNHNGGGIAFGPDGFLYFGLGDGGSGGDPQGHGQDRTELLGSMLRLNVSGTGSYTIPGSNPYAGSTTFRQELWNYGLRNPWRWSFDRVTGDLYIADVGQDNYEEVNVQPGSSTGGENYGWNTMEGTHCYGGAGCSTTGLKLPVLDYGHGQGCSVTGGYVYRGSAIPSIRGTYFYADYCSGWVRSFEYSNGQAVNRLDRVELTPGGNITSFGEDARGELYILTQNGRIQKIIAR